MTARRDRLHKHAPDELDDLIRWALWERVEGASPPPYTWDRIRAHVERPALWSLLKHRFAGGYQAVTVQTQRVGAGLSAFVTFLLWPRSEWTDWRREPYFMCLLGQYEFLLDLTF
jgi:hypothetical protein